MIEYSEAELKLIKKLSPFFYDLVKRIKMVPLSMYDLLMEDAFLNNKSGPEVDALRRVCEALKEGKVCRLTPEFDALCDTTNGDSR